MRDDRRDESVRYEIRVHGHLAHRWATWFDPMVLTHEPDGTTVLRGPVVDQAALHGLLQRLRDLAVPLISLTRMAPAEPGPPITRPRPTHPDHASGD